MDKRKDRWSITWEEWVSGGRIKIEDIYRDHDNGD